MRVAQRAVRQFRTALRERDDLSWVLLVYHKQDHQHFVDGKKPIRMAFMAVGEDLGPNATYALVCRYFAAFRTPAYH